MSFAQKFTIGIVALLAVACSAVRSGSVAHVTTVETVRGPKVLCVVAHPDDETAFAATVYKLDTLLGGATDLVVITNGEGGFKYSTLAERIYGAELTDEAVGRARLPAIRKRELEDGAAILGVHDIFFLDQKDHRYTTDRNEVLGNDAHVWDLEFVRRRLREILERGQYDFVFTLAPTPDTHAHHQSATLLALQSVSQSAESSGPIVLCVRTSAAGETKPLELVKGGPLAEFAELVDADHPFVFDRRQTFGHRKALDYRVIVNWEIAAHKSQGTMQLAMNQGDVEQFFLFANQRADAPAKCAKLFADLAGEQFATKTYAESAGTNAKP